MVDRLLLGNISRGSSILDVCCGTGLLAGHLLERGYAVTGVDASSEMLSYARREVPQAEFHCADAREFTLPPGFAGALCTFDSLSYMLTAEDLTKVFRNIERALRPGGRLVFDLSLEAAYLTEWGRACSIVEEDEAHFVRGVYHPADRLGKTMITSFTRNGAWTRSDVTFLVRCHAPDTVISCLRNAGFPTVSWYQSDNDPALQVELGPARACFVAHKELEG